MNKKLLSYCLALSMLATSQTKPLFSDSVALATVGFACVYILCKDYKKNKRQANIQNPTITDHLNWLLSKK